MSTESKEQGELGPLVTKAYVFEKQGAKAVLQDITLPALKATQVQVQMVSNGLCHTDIHMRDNDWGVSNFPMVAGHEGVGVVSELGSAVTTLKKGDRVGITWIRDSCRGCQPCLKGRENLCEKGYQGTFLGAGAGCWGKEAFNEHGGCFSQVMRIEAKWAFKIPESVPTDVCCPLMCGGGTVFEPICDYVTAGTKVAVLGIGGLGTAAIKLAHLSGGTVTAISGSAKKEAGARKAGASNFVDRTDADAMKAAAGSVDLIIDTTPAALDVAPLMDLLKFNGIYCKVGIPKAKDQGFSYNFLPLIFTQKKIVGSIVTGSARTYQMLELVKDHVKEMQDDIPDWTVQKMPFDKVNEAMDLLEKQENKGYRIMLEW